MTTKPAIPDAESMMNRHVHCVTPEMSLAEVVQVFLKHGVSCAPVVDRDGVVASGKHLPISEPNQE